MFRDPQVALCVCDLLVQKYPLTALLLLAFWHSLMLLLICQEPRRGHLRGLKCRTPFLAGVSVLPRLLADGEELAAISQEPHPAVSLSPNVPGIPSFMFQKLPNFSGADM